MNLVLWVTVLATYFVAVLALVAVLGAPPWAIALTAVLLAASVAAGWLQGDPL